MVYSTHQNLAERPFPAIGNPACTIWLTGLSGAGKSTLGRLLVAHLKQHARPCVLLDGDEIRKDLCCDLGFEQGHRDENIRRISSVARLLNLNDIFCVVAAISPYREMRSNARAKITRFLEVHVDCSLEILFRRDTKGLYQRALGGEVQNLSGVSHPYERPRHPDVYIDSGQDSERSCYLKIISALESRRWILSADQRQRQSA